MGAQVEEVRWPRVAGTFGWPLHGAEIEPHGDHRMAMAFAFAATGAEVNRDSRCRMRGCIFPRFFLDLERMVERLVPVREPYLTSFLDTPSVQRDARMRNACTLRSVFRFNPVWFLQPWPLSLSLHSRQKIPFGLLHL